ncbi:MAG TPA: DUF1440 domain-containing protein [Gaiellaceae bacterium]|jgi:hypothetical protein
MQTRTSLLAGVGLGLAAGAAGTAVMTALQETVARARGGGGESFKEPRTWAEAPAPAQLAKKALGRRVVKRQAPMITNAVHWGYGAALGSVYGVMQSRLQAHPLVHGVLFGTTVWVLSYATLVPLGIYEAPWRYPARELGVDWSYHAAYGLSVAGAFEALERL